MKTITCLERELSDTLEKLRNCGPHGSAELSNEVRVLAAEIKLRCPKTCMVCGSLMSSDTFNTTHVPCPHENSFRDTSRVLLGLFGLSFPFFLLAKFL